jgi:hypothetical protein
LRTYPYLISGLPFSVNSWPSIRYAELLLAPHACSLNDVDIFGGSCDELGDKLFGAAFSALTGLQPVYAMAIFVPVAGTFSILVFYAFVNELYGKRVSCVKRNSCVEFSEAKVIKRVQTIGRDLHYQGAQVAWVKIEHF